MMNTLLAAALLAVVGCARGDDTASTSGLDVLSARCDDLERTGSYAHDTIGWTSASVENPTVLLTTGALWYYGDPDDISTMGEEPSGGAAVQIAYLGVCPDNFRVFVMFQRPATTP